MLKHRQFVVDLRANLTQLATTRISTIAVDAKDAEDKINEMINSGQVDWEKQELIDSDVEITNITEEEYNNA